MKQASPTGTVDVTVLICVYNGEGTVSDLLFSALAQDTADQFQFEILVIDNNSTDRSPALIADVAEARVGKVRLLNESRQGKSYALNSGLAAARGHICCVIDQDERLPPGYLR